MSDHGHQDAVAAASVLGTPVPTLTSDSDCDDDDEDATSPTLIAEVPLSPYAMTPVSVADIDGELDPLDPLGLGLEPLPEEVYPRKIEARSPTAGYYVALGLVLSVWAITPFSCAYLVWFVLQGLSGPPSLMASLFAGYSITEVVFAIYMAYLARLVQRPSPPSLLPLEERTKLLHFVMSSDLAYPPPTRPRHRFDEDGTQSMKSEMEQEAWKMYELGHVSANQYHHFVDRHYEELNGMQIRRRVGKMTETEKETIDSFVEETKGEREARLRSQIESDVGYGQDDFDQEASLTNRKGDLAPLHSADRRAVEFRERLRTWFFFAPWEKLRRGNVRIWLSWACFGEGLDEVERHEDKQSFLARSLDMFEARTGMALPEGYDPSIKVIRLTMDPVNAKGRPLILYAGANLVNWYLQNVVYPSYGLASYKEGDFEYLVRIPPGWTPERARSDTKSMPVIYSPGLGFGLLQSHLLIKQLVTTLSSHPIMVIIHPHTSQNIFHPRYLSPLARTELVPVLKKACRKWGFWEETSRGPLGGVSLLSHSNGSIAHAWLLKDCPTLVKRNTFVDPVCFGLWEGDICYSFCYREPKTSLELLLYYFIASEVGIANYIQRHFDWADNTLFAKDIPHLTDSSRTAFFFGAEDIIIDAARARKYLERHGVRGGMHWDPKGGHGDGMAGSSLARVIQYVGTGSTQGWSR